MRRLAAVLMFACFPAVAGASGGFSCEAENEDVVLALDGGVTRGMGSALFSFSGRIEVSSDQVRPDLRTTEFTRDHVAQYWLDGDTMRLRLYRERAGDAPHGYVEAIVETATGDDGNDHGEYIVAVYDMTDAVDGEVEPVQFTGAVTCSVE